MESVKSGLLSLVLVAVMGVHCVNGMTVTQQSQFKRMSAKEVEDSSQFFDSRVKTVTLRVKCFLSGITTGVTAQQSGRFAAFGAYVLGEENERQTFLYAAKASRVFKDLCKYLGPDKESMKEVYVLLEKPTADIFSVDGQSCRITGGWIKEFMTPDVYETGKGSKLVAKKRDSEKNKWSGKGNPEDSIKDTPSASGSGFFITRSGYLITNHHVVSGGSKFKVLTDSGAFDAKLIHGDPNTDLALLKVTGEFPYLKLSPAKKEKLGAEIFTMGFPRPGVQGFSPKVTKGIVSGEDGYQGDVREYQIDASIQPGNSGGPLLDMNGNLVGVLVSTLRGGQLVNYAIKKTYLTAFLDSVSDFPESMEIGEALESHKPLSDVVEVVRSRCVLVWNFK